MNSWLNLNDFKRDFIKIYSDQKYREEIINKCYFWNQKTDQDIHSFLTEIRKLFTKLHPRKDLMWELRRTSNNLKLDYKIYIKRNDFNHLKKWETLGEEWESELVNLLATGKFQYKSTS